MAQLSKKKAAEVAARIEEVRNATRDDVIDKLNRYHRCIIIRPTGYGKTYLLTELISKYKKVLYLYPAEVIAETVKNRYYALHDSDVDEETVESVEAFERMSNVTLMTYAKLIRLTDADFKAMDYDCIITDEAHRLGGGRTKFAMSKLMVYRNNADFIGATATPNRTDSFDVVSMFFNNIMTFPYTLHDAIQDGMLQKPNYCYCTTDVDADLKEAALTAGEDLKDVKVQEVLKKKYVELVKLFNMENIIRTYCEKYVKDTSYMKFIVFFANKQQMSDKLEDVKGWFKEAYPNHSIEVLEVSSRSMKTQKNVKELESLSVKKNTITLIACIDMLNMGYHVNNLTGILMYRGTKSDIIYIQQLGRTLSSGASDSALVFDVVDNLHRLAVYDIADVNGRKLTKSKKKATQKKKAKVSIWKVEEGQVIDTEGNAAPFEVKDGKIVDLYGNETNLIVDEETGMVVDTADVDKDYLHCNDINEDSVNRVDLTDGFTMNGHTATYREFIAKAVAEPMSQRCRIAINLHFDAWCRFNGIENPISNEESHMAEGMTKEEFLAFYKGVINRHQLAYPLQDAEKLVRYGADGKSRMVPLQVCADAKNVSIGAILDLLGVA